jgi:hypothetical protein
MFDRSGKTVTKEGPCAVYPEIGLNLIPGIPFAALHPTFPEKPTKCPSV